MRSKMTLHVVFSPFPDCYYTNVYPAGPKKATENGPLSIFPLQLHLEGIETISR